MSKFMVISSMVPEALSEKQAKQFEAAIQDSSEVMGHQSFYNLTEGKAVWILEAQDQQALAEWFQRMEMPYERITSVEAAVYHGTVTANSAEEAADKFAESIAALGRDRLPVSDTEEDNENVSEDEKEIEIFAECDWCKAPIYHGNASVEVTRHIQQVDADAITVIHAEALLTLCAQCGNRLSEEKLREALKEPQAWQTARPPE